MNQIEAKNALVQEMQRLTPARVALGRFGNALPTREVLRFSMDHAKARDAVHRVLNVDQLLHDLPPMAQAALRVQSRAESREQYLVRPDLGRRLRGEDASRLRDSMAQADAAVEHALDPAADPAAHAAAHASRARLVRSDLCIVLADGLSAQAVQTHAPPLLAVLMQRLPPQWKLSPLVVAEQARVALGDEIALCLQADMVAVLIGERPGLSSPDSLGIYLTWKPAMTTLDSARNCISNVRPQGLAIEDAANRLAWLLQQAHSRRLSGIGLKDESGGAALVR
jgi:ethanolamine ammonia-lyase small subunit